MDSSRKRVTTPEVALIAITRTELGVGIGLLLARKLNDQARVVTGFSMLAIGVVTTVPLVIEVFGGRSANGRSQAPVEVSRRSHHRKSA